MSLEGKANYLSPIIQRNNLTSPLLVVPLLAGWDVAQRIGRIFEYDGAGGCYERFDFSTIGSGTPFAEGTLRLGLQRRHDARRGDRTRRTGDVRGRATTTRAPGDRTSCATSSR